MLITNLSLAADELSFNEYYNEAALMRQAADALVAKENELEDLQGSIDLLNAITLHLDSIEASDQLVYSKLDLLAPFYTLFGVANA